MEPGQRRQRQAERRNPLTTMRKLILYIALISMAACQQQPERNYRYAPMKDSVLMDTGSYPALADSTAIDSVIEKTTDDVVNTRDVAPSSVVSFAHTLKGTPYKYGSTNPQQ